MRLLFLIIFLFLHNCANPLVGEKRVFICGDHPCVNQKEVDEYFNNKAINSLGALNGKTFCFGS